MGYFKNPLELSVGLAASPGIFTSPLRFPHKRAQGSFLQGTASMSLQEHQRGGRQAQLSSCSPTVSQPPGKGSPISGVVTLAHAITSLPGTPPWPMPSALSLGRHPGPCHQPSPWDATLAHAISPLPGTPPWPKPSALSLGSPQSLMMTGLSPPTLQSHLFSRAAPWQPEWLVLGCCNVR